MQNVLVIYYSYEGHTEEFANIAKEKLGCDILSVKPKNEMTKKGFSKYIWGGMSVIMGNTPSLEDFDTDISKYDLIIIGSPIWAGTYAPPIKTLFKNEYIVNKKLAYFYCHQGGADKAALRSKEEIEKHNKLESSFGININDDYNFNMLKFKTWIDELKHLY